MSYQSYDQQIAELRQQGFYIYTNYCQKVELMKVQAESLFNDYLTNLGHLFIRIQGYSKQSEILKQQMTHEFVSGESDEDEDPSDSQSSKSSIKSAKELARHRKRIQRNLNNKKQRNALTNLGSQLLTYIYLKKKNLSTIKAKFPRLTPEQINSYYEWARRIKQSMNGYINIEKLKEVWELSPQVEVEKLYLGIFRTLSLHYINELMVPAILTSKKIANNGKVLHLSARRKLLEAVRSIDFN